jgi:hypothetical protein
VKAYLYPKKTKKKEEEAAALPISMTQINPVTG